MDPCHRGTVSSPSHPNQVVAVVMQSNRHGLPMPPTPTALLVLAVVACLWALGLVAMGFLIAGAVVGAVAAACAVLAATKRRQANRLR